MNKMSKSHLLEVLAFSFLGMLLSSACQTEYYQTYYEVERELTFKGALEEESKTIRDDAAKIYWTPGDAISVFYGSGSNGGSKFVAETEIPSLSSNFKGTITVVEGGSDENSGGQYNYFWALYPYDENAESNGETITMTMLSRQIAGEGGTFSSGMAPTIARSLGLVLSFKNIWSGFGFSVSESGYTSLSIRGNGEEILAGRARVGFNAEDNTPEVAEILEGVSEVTIEAPDGFVPGKYYYVQFFPQTMPLGFTAQLKSPSRVGTFVYSNSRRFARSIWTRVSDLDSRCSIEETGTPPNDEIWYSTSNGGVESPYNQSAFGASIVSNTYDNGKGIIKFDGPVVCIGETAFKKRKNIVTMLFPGTVTSIGNEAFSGCSGLENISIPDDVISIGESAFMNCSELASIDLPSGLTVIENKAFVNCKKLSSISIPNNVSSIGEYAFQGTSSLSGIVLPEGMTKIAAFCFTSSGLQSIILPEGLKIIDEFAFSGCQSLRSVVLPHSLESIGSYSFASCQELKEISLLENVSIIKIGAFDKCTSLEKIIVNRDEPPTGAAFMFRDTNDCPILVPYDCVWHFRLSQYWEEYADRIVSIDGRDVGEESHPDNEIWYTTDNGQVIQLNNTASFNANLISNEYKYSRGVLTFDAPVTTIGNNAFYNMFRVLDISLPETVKAIEDEAFNHCLALESIELPEGLEYIGAGAFSHCWMLGRLVIPSTVKSIGPRIVYDCDNLSVIEGRYVTEDHKSIVMDGRLIGVAQKGLTEYVVPEGVIELGDYAFARTTVSDIVLPSSLERIGDGVFEYCHDLVGLGIPDNVNQIGDDVFYGCDNLSSITGRLASEDNRCLILDGVLKGFAKKGITDYTIPSGVIGIARNAFYYCLELSEITIPESVSFIGDSAFSVCVNMNAVHIKSFLPYPLGNKAFDGNYSVYVPAHTLNIFMANSAWKALNNRLKGEESTSGTDGSIENIGYDVW